MSEQSFFQEAPTIMFHRLQVWNWGPYLGHDFVFDAGIIDFVGENGSGKSSLIDAMRVALGLHHQNYLHKRRKKIDYARLNGPVAHIALTIHNQPRGLTRRMFGGKDRLKTVVVRVDKEGGSGKQLHYKMFDGEVELQDIVEQEKWRAAMTPKEYDALWSRAGYNVQDRKNRVFDIATPDAVAKSKPHALYDLFTTFANNAEDSAKLDESRRKLEDTRRALEDVTNQMSSVYSQWEAAKVQLSEATTLVELYETMEHQRRLARVREYEDAVAARKRAQQDVSAREKRAAELRDEREQLLQSQKNLKVEVERLSIELRGREKNLETQVDRLKKVEDDYDEASDKGNQARREQKQYQAFVDAKLPPTNDLRKRRQSLLGISEELNKHVGAAEYRIGQLEERIETLEKHRVPVSIQLCVEELRSEGIPVQPAWEILPQDGDQVLEDALGRLRFGLLGASSAQAKALSIMRKHRYPGPFSTREAKEYARMCQGTWNRLQDGFETQVGVFVEGATPPVLNRDLVKSHIQELHHERLGLQKEAQHLSRRHAKVAEDIDEVAELLAQAKHRDELQSRKNTWVDLIAAHEELRVQRDRLREEQHMAQRRVQETKVSIQAREDRLSEARQRRETIDDELADAGRSSLKELDDDVATTRRACESFYAEYKDIGPKFDADKHQARADAAREEIGGRVSPTGDAIKQLKADVDSKKARYESHRDLKEQKGRDVVDAEANHERLLAHRKAQLHAAYTRVKKTVQELAERTGIAARLKLQEEDGQGALYYTVDIRGLGRFEPLTSPKLSTGERLKGALVFLIGLTNPDDEAFYIFDEPGKHFGSNNMQAMYTLFEHTNAQVLLTSTNEPEDPDGIRCRRFYMPQLVNERAPRTEKVLIAT